MLRMSCWRSLNMQHSVYLSISLSLLRRIQHGNKVGNPPGTPNGDGALVSLWDWAFLALWAFLSYLSNHNPVPVFCRCNGLFPLALILICLNTALLLEINKASSGKSESKLSCQALSAHKQSQTLYKYSFPLSHLFFLVSVNAIIGSAGLLERLYCIRFRKPQGKKGNNMKPDAHLKHAVL